MNNPFYPRPMPWEKLLGCELVFATFYRKHLWSVEILETWHDARDDSTRLSVLNYDMYWHRGDQYTCAQVGSSPYKSREQVAPFHPSGPYGLPVSYWVKDGFQITPYPGCQQIINLPSWVQDLFFLQDLDEREPLRWGAKESK